MACKTLPVAVCQWVILPSEDIATSIFFGLFSVCGFQLIKLSYDYVIIV